MISQPTIPAPTHFGWSIDDASDKFVPILSRRPMAPDTILNLVRCNCTTSLCSGRCSCRENLMPCTELCKCDQDSCKNLTHSDEFSDESDSE